MISRLIAAAAPFLLTACFQPPVLSQTPRSITLCYDAILDDPQESADRAEAHCQASGLHAVEAGGGQCAPGYIRVVYQCLP